MINKMRSVKIGTFFHNTIKKVIDTAKDLRNFNKGHVMSEPENIKQCHVCGRELEKFKMKHCDVCGKYFCIHHDTTAIVSRGGKMSAANACSDCRSAKKMKVIDSEHPDFEGV